MKPNGRNGKPRQLKAEQQLMLRTIQARVFRHQAEAGELVRQATVAKDQALAADQEFQAAVRAYAKQLGVDLNTVRLDIDKLQFVPPPSGEAKEPPA